MKKNFVYLSLGLIVIIILLFIIFWPGQKPKKIYNPKNESILLSDYNPESKILIYFSESKNSLIQWNLATNQAQTIYQFEKNGIDWVIYSPDHSFALAHWTDPEDGVSNKCWLINLFDRKIRELPQNIESAAWQGDSKKIIYHVYDFNGTDNNLSLYTLEDAKVELLTLLTDSYYQIFWVDQKIIFHPLTTEAGTVNLYAYDFNTKKTSYLATNIFIGGSNKFNNQSLLFTLGDNAGNYKLYLYSISEKKFKLIDKKTLAWPILKTNNSSFTATELSNKKLSLVKFENFRKEKIKFNLGKISSVTDLFYKDNVLYFVADGGLYAAE